MEDKVFAAHFNRHIDHLAHALLACPANTLVAIHEGNIRRGVETEADIFFGEAGADALPGGGGEFFGEIPRIIQIQLNQSKAVLAGKPGQLVEIAPAGDIGKADPPQPGPGRFGYQVFRSFFLAAGNRTLFNISL
jgi:hypothetical protein